MPFSFFTILASQIKKARFGSSRKTRRKYCQLEILEERTLLATYQWSGGGGTTNTAWESSANWVLVPGTGTGNVYGYPAVMGDVAQFFSAGSSASFTTTQTPTITTDSITVGEIDFGTTVSVTLSSDGGDTITLQNATVGSANPGIIHNETTTTIPCTISASVYAPFGLSILNQSKGGTRYSSPITATNGLTINMDGAGVIVGGGGTNTISADTINFTNDSTAGSTISGPFSASNAMNYTDGSTAASTISGAMSATNALTITNQSDGALTASAAASFSASTVNLTITDLALTTNLAASIPGVSALNITNQSDEPVTMSGAINAPNSLNVNITNTSLSTTAITSPITVQNGFLTITYQTGTTAPSTIAGEIDAPMGLSIILQSGVSGIQTVQSTILATSGMNAIINSGTLLLTSASSEIASNSTFTVNAGATLSVGASQAEIGAGTTILLNNNSTFKANNAAGVFLANDFVIGSGSSASVAFTGGSDSLTLGDPAATSPASTITLNGADTIALATSPTVFNDVDIMGTDTAASNSLTFTGTNYFGIMGDLTFTGSNSISLSGSALAVSASNTMAVYTPTVIQNNFNDGTGSLTLTGTSALTLSGADLFGLGTTIQSGTLIVDGAVSSSIAADPTGMLMGDGTITGAITAPGGTVQPGDPNTKGGIGILTASSADFTNTGTLVIQVAGFTTAGVNYDRLNLGNLGSSTLNLDSSSSITLDLVGLQGGGVAAGIIQASAIYLNGSTPGSFSNVSITFTNTSPSLVIPTQPANGLDYASTPGAVNLDIDSTPVFTSAGSATFTVGSSSTFTVMATGYPAPTFSETGSMPTGVSLSPTGVLSGIPALGTANTYNDTITATNTINGSSTTTSQPFTLTVVPASTTTSLVDTGSNPQFAGSPATFTATINGAVGATAGDTVTLYDGNLSNPVGSSTLSGSSASVSFTVTTLPVGSDSVFAVFSGDVNNAPSTSSDIVQQILSDTVTSTALTDNGPNPSLNNGQAVSFTVAVSTTHPPITGDTVTLYQVGNSNAIGSMTLGSSSDSVTFSVTNLPVGSDSIYAVFGGDANNGPSTSSTAVQVVQGITETALTDNSANPSTDAQSDTFTVTVTGATGIAGETVTLHDASNSSISIGSSTLSSLGNSSYSVAIAVPATTLAVGSHSIYAVYGGDSLNVGSTSNQVVQTVNGATYQWTGAAGNDSWNVPGNWNVNGVPQTVAYPRQSPDVAQFFSGGSSGSFTTAQTALVNLPITVGELDINSTVAVTINASTGDSLTLQYLSGQPGVLNIEAGSTTTTTTITAPIVAPNGLILTNQSAGTTSLSTSTISAGGPVTITNDNSGASTISDTISATGSVSITNAGSAANTISGAIIAPNGLNILSDSTAASTISGPITANGGLTITQPVGATGTLTLSSAITAPLGLTATISAGEILLNSALSAIAGTSTFTVNSGGTLAGGPNSSQFGVGSTIVLNNGSTLRSNNGNGMTLADNFIIGSDASVAFTVDAIAFGSASPTLGASTFTLNGADTVTMTTTTTTFAYDVFSGNNDSFGNPPSLTLTGASSIGVLGNATFTGNNPISIYGPSALTLNGADSLTINTPTVIQDNLNQNGSLTVIGNSTNTLTLSGTDTYAGGTIVQSGTLIVNGSLRSSSTVTVNVGATLMGDGTVGAIAAPGGTVQPGGPNSIGILTASSANFASGGTLVIQIAGFATPGVSYDRLNLGSGILTLDGTSSITLNLAGVSAGGAATGIILAGPGSSSFASTNVNSINEAGALAIPAQPLVYNYTGTPAPAGVNLDIDSAPVITSAGSATFAVDLSSTFTVTTTGFPTPTITETGPLPGGVAFNAGVLTGTPTPGTAGTYNDTFTATNIIGSVTQTFTQPFTFTVTPIALTDNSLSPSLFGQAVSYTAAVLTNNPPMAGDTVTLYQVGNNNPLGSLTLGSGNDSVTFTVSNPSLPVGSDSIYAVFSGDANNAASTSNTVVQVVESSTTTTLTDNGPNPALLNQALGVNFTVSVTGGAAVSGETVTLEDASNGNATVGAGTLTNGSTTITVTNLTLGSHSIFAAYSGDATHAGSQSNQVSQTVGGLLAAISVLPSVEPISQFYVYWSGAAASGWAITSYTIYVSDNGAPYIAWQTNTTLTSALYQGQYGQTYSFYSVVNGTNSQSVAQTSAPSTVTTTTVPGLASLTVTSFTPTATGFTSTFTEPFLNTSTNPIHLYSEPSLNANYGPADITIVGPNGPVTGSLLVNATNSGFTFVKTNVATGGGTAGLLAPGNYTVTFLSGPTGFQDTNGNQLDSTGTGLAGSNYVTTFTVTAPAANAVTVSIPDFARGPDSNDSINLINNTGNGIPITLSIPAGDSITSGSVTISYNTSQLSIAGAFPNPSLSGMSFTLSGSSSPGTAIVNFSTSTPLGSSSATVNVGLGGLIAYTPGTAAYKSYEVLQISSSLNGGAIPTINDNAVQVVAFLGNVSGNGSNPNGFDSGLMLNVASGLDAGFSQFPVIDPVILGSLIGGETQLTTQDVLQLNLYNNTHSNPYVPFYPGAPSNNPSGPDPTLSIPTSLTVNAEGTVLVPVNIDDAHPAGSTGMTVAQLALKYDPTEFSVTPQDVQLGSVPDSGTGWTLQAVVDASTGTIGITLYSETPIDTTAGSSLVVIALHELSTATPGATAIELVSSVTANGQMFSTSVNDMQGPFTLTPGPTNSGVVPGLEATVLLQGTSIPPVAISGNNVEQVAGLPELAAADNVALVTPGIVPTAAVTDTPVAIIEDRAENTSAAVIDVVIEPDTVAAPANSIAVNADHDAATLAPSVLVNANVNIEAAPANGYVFTVSAGLAPAAGGNPLFNVSMGPQSCNSFLPGSASAAGQATQRLANQLFLNLALGEAGPTLQSAESARGRLRDDEQPFDLLSQNDDESAATDTGVLDGHFALIAADGAAESD